MLSLLILGIQVVYGSDDFDYKQNGKDWPNIHDYCFGKSQQSPINLDNNYTIANEDDFYFFPKYKPTKVKMEKNNKTSDKVITVDDADSFGPLYTVNTSLLSVGYQGKIIFFRSKAEHRINGVQHNLEVQIWHDMLPNISNYRSTVSVFFTQDDTAPRNPFLQTIIDNYDREEFIMDLSELITSAFSIQPYYLYAGSWTFPDCTERMHWYLFERPFKAPSSQLQFFYNLYHGSEFFPNGNCRELQDRKTTARKVKLFYRKDPYATTQEQE